MTSTKRSDSGTADTVTITGQSVKKTRDPEVTDNFTGDETDGTQAAQTQRTPESDTDNKLDENIDMDAANPRVEKNVPL